MDIISQAVDLFGQIPVTLRDVEVWLFKVPRLSHFRRGRAAYVKGYNVIEKIARAKAEGWHAEAVPDEQCEFCGQLLAADLVVGMPSMSPEAEIEALRRRIAVLEALMALSRDEAKISSRNDLSC